LYSLIVLELSKMDLSKLGESKLGPIEIEVIDAVKPYVAYLKEIFDFDAPRQRCCGRTGP
jgi:phosphoglucomutase